MKASVVALGLILLSAAAVVHGADIDKSSSASDIIGATSSKLRDYLKDRYVYVNPSVLRHSGGDRDFFVDPPHIQTDVADSEGGHGWGGGFGYGGFGGLYALPVYSVGYAAPLYGGGYGYGCNSALYGGYGYGSGYGGYSGYSGLYGC